MNETTKKMIRKIQADLIRIDNKEVFFYNIAQYEKLGLIKRTYHIVSDCNQNKEIELKDLVLTEKAKQYIKIAV